MRRKKVVKKGKAARKFNKSVHRTKKVNMQPTVRRGGFRL